MVSARVLCWELLGAFGLLCVRAVWVVRSITTLALMGGG